MFEEKEEKDFIREPANMNIKDLKPERPTVGDEMPVLLWRLIRIVGMHHILGEETPTAVYFIGKKIGRLLEIHSTEELQKTLTELKVGKLKILSDTPNFFQIAIGECVTCSGIHPPLGKAICQLETGIVAGALEHIYQDKKVIGEETKCIGGLGDEVCQIECQII